jgi:hypothetical protein
MQRMLIPIVAGMGIVLGLGGTSSADMLMVIGFSHPPNYKLCTDQNDIHQLTDRKVTTFPIWMQKETVGWAAATPIAIELRLILTGTVQRPQSGRLRLHSAKGLGAGVDIPRHVDVYARDDNDKLILVGSLTPNSGKLPDKSAYWLDIDIQAATDSLVVVLHAAGDYLFLDEIEWLASGTGHLSPSLSNIGNVRAALEDSIRRVSRGLKKSAALEVEEATLSLTDHAVYVWSQDPWNEINLADVRQQINNRPSLVEVRGYVNEHESICLGIIVGKDVASTGIRATVSGLSSQSVKFYEVRSVIAGNGKRVYDPLVPLDERGTLSAKPGEPVYLWMDLNFVALGPGNHRFEIRLDSGGRVDTVPGMASVSAYTGQGVTRLRAVNWAYLSDLPVFRNKTVAAQDLVRHGINTFVAHPAEIPGVALDGSWRIKPDSNFLTTVELAKQHGMLLLYLGWSDIKNPLNLPNRVGILDAAAKKRLLGWVQKISAYLAERGLPLDHWALYPVDEPSRQGLQVVKAVALAIKEWNPAVQVYTDLNIYANPPIELSDLRDVQNLVDYWQPNVLVVRSRLGDFFKELQKDWWIYGNPKSPAKLASPLHDYRMLAWWAWYYGASGVGFWSYSDTGGSSAWEDIDGRRPDWAVVYETPEGIVSSRRWEAFREGLEDYVLLSGMKRTEAQKSMPSGKQNFDLWNLPTVEGVRRALLDAL